MIVTTAALPKTNNLNDAEKISIDGNSIYIYTWMITYTLKFFKSLLTIFILYIQENKNSKESNISIKLENEVGVKPLIVSEDNLVSKNHLGKFLFYYMRF